MSRISSCRGVLTPWCPDVGARAMVIYSISGRPRKLATMAMGVVYSSRDGRSTWHCRIKKCRRDACGVGIQLQTCGDVILVNDSLGWSYPGLEVSWNVSATDMKATDINQVEQKG